MQYSGAVDSGELTAFGNILATRVKEAERKAELPTASTIRMAKENPMKVWQSYILLRKPNATHMVPVVRMPPLKARPIPICARRTYHSIFGMAPISKI